MNKKKVEEEMNTGAIQHIENNKTNKLSESIFRGISDI